MSEASGICQRMYDLAKEHNGQNKYLTLNGVDILIIQRAEDADHILRLNAANYVKNLSWLRQIIGASRFSEDGEKWRIRQQISQPFFNKIDRDQLVSATHKYALTALDTLIEKNNQPTLRDNVFRTLTSNILLDSFFGCTLDDIGLDLDILADLMELGSAFSFSTENTVDDFYQKTKSLPRLRRQMLESFSNFRQSPICNTPLMKKLLEAEKGTDKINLTQELTAFIAAGSETSAATASWLCYLLAKHPELQQRLRDDADTFWQSGEINWKQLSTFQSLTQFVSETLRLFPPTPLITRTALSEDVLGDYKIIKDQKIILSLIGIQHDRRFRDNPWQMAIDEPKSHKTSGDIMAFSMGPRVCGGKQFALIELVSLLATFVQHAYFELTSDSDPVFHWKSQMLHKNGVPVRVLPLS